MTDNRQDVLWTTGARCRAASRHTPTLLSTSALLPRPLAALLSLLSLSLTTWCRRRAWTTAATLCWCTINCVSSATHVTSARAHTHAHTHTHTCTHTHIHRFHSHFLGELGLTGWSLNSSQFIPKLRSFRDRSKLSMSSNQVLCDCLLHDTQRLSWSSQTILGRRLSFIRIKWPIQRNWANVFIASILSSHFSVWDVVTVFRVLRNQRK